MLHMRYSTTQMCVSGLGNDVSHTLNMEEDQLMSSVMSSRRVDAVHDARLSEKSKGIYCNSASRFILWLWEHKKGLFTTEFKEGLS